MGRPRKAENSDLPLNLLARHRAKQGKTYYYYRDPISRKEESLGEDKAAAMLHAIQRNSRNHLQVEAMRRGAVIEGWIPIIKAGNIDETGLYTEATIVKASRAIRKISGIYFLINDGRIVYVGQSNDVATRIASHIREDVKLFSTFAIIEAKREDLNNLEAKYIAKFKPTYNFKKPVFKMATA